MYEKKFDEFVAIVRRLRKECPWDREQDNDSIKANTIEEAYEVVEAIDNKDYDELKKELGDLLLHVVFHTVIVEESNKFTLEDVIDTIMEKLIRRHPHVFGTTEVNDSEEVKTNWEALKMKEGRKSVLDGLPRHMPALIRAYRVQEKASKVGFDWDEKGEVWKKVIEEIDELREAENAADKEQIEDELGDLLFSITNYSRFLGLNPEDALRKSTRKFESRFKYIEKKIAESNRTVDKASFEEMDALWDESKKAL